MKSVGLFLEEGKLIFSLNQMYLTHQSIPFTIVSMFGWIGSDRSHTINLNHNSQSKAAIFFFCFRNFFSPKSMREGAKKKKV